MAASSHYHTASRKGAAPAGAGRQGDASKVAKGTDDNVPEWMTEAWKHRVEGEARRKLKDHIRGIGAGR